MESMAVPRQISVTRDLCAKLGHRFHSRVSVYYLVDLKRFSVNGPFAACVEPKGSILAFAIRPSATPRSVAVRLRSSSFCSNEATRTTAGAAAQQTRDNQRHLNDHSPHQKSNAAEATFGIVRQVFGLSLWGDE
jgi:hypothetical protein